MAATYLFLHHCPKGRGVTWQQNSYCIRVSKVHYLTPIQHNHYEDPKVRTYSKNATTSSQMDSPGGGGGGGGGGQDSHSLGGPFASFKCLFVQRWVLF